MPEPAVIPGRRTTEYVLSLAMVSVAGVCAVLSGVVALVREPAWWGLVGMGGSLVAGAGVVVIYSHVRGKVKHAESLAGPMRAAVKPSSRTV